MSKIINFLILLIFYILLSGIHPVEFPVKNAVFQPSERRIPRKLWTFWKGQPTSFVTACINTWKLYNPEYSVVILSRENVHEYVDITLPSNFDTIQVQFQADFVRLAVLYKHGGIWIDASMIMTGSIQFIHDLQESEETEGFMYYLKNWTFDSKYPYYENWLIAAIPHSLLIHHWLQEFRVCFENFGMKDTYLVYLSKIFSRRKYNELVQGNVMPYYLKQHMALQKVLQIDEIRGFSKLDAVDDKGPLLVQSLSGWRNDEIALILLRNWRFEKNSILIPIPPLIKIRSEERKFLTLFTTSNFKWNDAKWFWLRVWYNIIGFHPKIEPESIYAKYLANK